jgi:hypothetical protein
MSPKQSIGARHTFILSLSYVRLLEKTKRYTPLHLIDPTCFTEGKTMREAAGGRSAWI